MQFTNEQIQEVKEVLRTLIDATDHFTYLIEQEELKQGVQILTSIVEGMESIFKVLKQSNTEFHLQMKRIEELLVFIGESLKKGELTDIPKIAQEELKPEIIKIANMEI